jgi:hypothetical protein
VEAPVGDARSVLRDEAYWRWSAATILLRMPGFMTPLAFVLVALYATGDRRVGGLMVAAEVVALGVCGPLLAPLIDRFGPRRSLIWMSFPSALVFLGLAYATGARGPAAVLIAAGALTGAVGAPRTAGARTLLDEVVPRRLQREALSLNATLSEIAVLTAPLLIGAASLLTPVAVPVVMAALLLAGAALIPGLPRLPRDVPSEAEATPPRRGLSVFLRSRSFWLWLGVELAFGQVLGTVETAALPWAHALGLGTFAAAAALAILSAAGILASLLYLRMGSGAGGRRARAEAIGLVAILVAGALVFALSTRWAVGAAAMALTGVATVPLNGLTAHAAAAAMPAERRAEGFALLASMYMVGYALGSLALALLPLRWTLLSGAAVGLAVLALTPLWASEPATAA